MLGGKIRDFSITTTLAENHAYLAGSTVEGHVIIDIKKPKAINGPIRIVLSGQARVKWTVAAPISSHIPESLTRSQPCSDEQTVLDNITVNLWGTGSERLATGKHQFPYAFQLPADIPSSHNDLFGHIKYTLTATIPISKRDITTQKLISVRGIVIMNTPELMEPVSGSCEKTIAGGLCCLSAPFTVSGKIDKGGYTCGDKITVKVIHGYRRITNVQAFLRRKVTYHIRETGKANFNYKNIANVDFNGEIMGYLNIPDTVSSTSCDVLKVSYYVVVKLLIKLPNVRPLTVELPITIGNGQVSAQNGSTPTHLSHSNAVVSPVMPSAPSFSLQDTNRNMRIEPCVMPSAPPHPSLSSLQDTNRNMRTEPCVMPSAPLHPSISVDIQPVSSIDGIEVPDTPPPPYSEH